MWSSALYAHAIFQVEARSRGLRPGTSALMAANATLGGHPHRISVDFSAVRYPQIARRRYLTADFKSYRKNTESRNSCLVLPSGDFPILGWGKAYWVSGSVAEGVRWIGQCS